MKTPTKIKKLTARKIVKFIERLKHPEGTEWAGKPIVLHEWEKNYIRTLIDTVDELGRTRYETSLLFLPKKQGKTTLIAALAVAFLFLDEHQQIAAVSNSKDQASLIYKFARSMVEQEPSLADRCEIYKGNRRSIECESMDSTLTVYSSDAVTANGLNCSKLLYDEVCFEESSDLWDAIVSGGINRTSILAIGLSTAGFSTSGFGYRLYSKAKAIQKNPELDPSFLPVIYEAPEGADWTDVQSYLDCSPTFREGGGEAIRRIERMIASAKNNPSEIRMLLRYHLNQWVGTDSKEPWISIEMWDACPNTLNPERLIGRRCFGGLDMASVRDMNAFALVFDLENGEYAALLRFYMAADLLEERERRDPGALYTTWAKMGLLVTTPGDWCDYAFIRADINKLRELYQIEAVGIDRVYNAAHISQELITDGINIIPIGQGNMTVAPAAREVETLVSSRKFTHFNNPILRWNVSNCITKMADDAGNVRPSKKRSTGRIDGVYALVDAFAVESLYRTAPPTEDNPDVYVG